MALYRRFAVYLYQYQGAKKGAGAGFGMIELRDGRIRMQLTGRGSVSQGNLEVYGLLDSPAHAGVRLGSMQAGRFVLEAGEDIGEGKSFSDLRGIVLTARPGAERAAAALWNGTFDAGRFEVWKAPEHVPEAKDVRENSSEAEKVPEYVDDVEEAPENVLENVIDAAEALEHVSGEENALEHITDAEEVSVSVADAEKAQEYAPDDRAEMQQLLQELPSQEDAAEEISGENSLAEACQEAAVSEDTSEEEVDNGQIPDNILVPDSCKEEDGEKEEHVPHLDFASAALDLVEFGEPLEIVNIKPCAAEPVRESVLWQRLSKQYPKMNIPARQGALSCLRIRPCDINRLPKENWKYGCSHFLAGHYNRYRCLILGRTKHENGWEYFMGVPGGSTPQERKQAADAGFDHYIAVEKGHHQWPEGFWLVQLQWAE